MVDDRHGESGVRSDGLTPAVSVDGLGRRFGSTVALDGVDVELRFGEIHAVLGENGAGKTTLMRVVAGLDRPDDGEVRIAGRRVTTFDPRLARDDGVALVQQHFTLVPTLTAGENLVLARPSGRWLPDRRRAAERVADLSDRFGLPVRTDVPAGELSVGEQQRLELLRALDADARILLLDEPTAVLTDAEAVQLLDVCRRLADDGRAVAIITHRLGEVIDGCDRATVLRRGSVVVADRAVADTDRDGLASAMIGGAPAELPHRRDPSDGATHRSDRAPTLRLTGVSWRALHDVDLEVHPGEIVGVAGVDGNGQAELEAVVSGRARPESGSVTINGADVVPTDPAARIESGVGYIPSDRYRHALVRPMELSDNLTLGRTARVRPRRSSRRDRAVAPLDRWDVRSAGPSARAASLSGGNAQKLVLARELADDPVFVLACHPTRGLDPGAAALVASRLIEAASAGASVLWVGAELDELLDVSDRLVVMSDGRIVARFDGGVDRDAVGRAMTVGRAAGAATSLDGASAP